MVTFFTILLLVSIIGLCIGLISPSVISKVLRRQMSRKQAVLVFGGLSVFSFVMVGVFAPPVPKQQEVPALIQEATPIQSVEETLTPTIAKDAGQANLVEEAPAPVAAAVQEVPDPNKETFSAPVPTAQVMPTPSASSPVVDLPNPTPVSAPTTQSDDPAVKKSTNNICHQKGTRYYSQTKNYTPYATLQACLDSGGRMPK